MGGRVLVPALPLAFVALALLARELPLWPTAAATAVLALALVSRYLGDDQVARQAGSWRNGARVYRAAGEIPPA